MWGTYSPGVRGEVISIVLQQPLDVIELFLRAGKVAEALAQFLDDAAGALHVDLARHFYRRVVAVFAPAQRPAERISVLLRARLTEAAGPAGPGTAAHLLLHRLRQALRTFAQGIERAALRVHRAVGIALAEIAGSVAHGIAGVAELIELLLALSLALCLVLAGRALPLLALLAFVVLAKAATLEFLHQFVEPVAQRLLALPQIAKGIAVGLRVPEFALATAALTLLLALLLALLLSLLESAVAQLLLLADHLAQLVERRHHVIVALVHVRHAHLQVLHQFLQLLQKLARGVLGAAAG